eukprot:s1102_g9.t1
MKQDPKNGLMSAWTRVEKSAFFGGNGLGAIMSQRLDGKGKPCCREKGIEILRSLVFLLVLLALKANRFRDFGDFKITHLADRLTWGPRTPTHSPAQCWKPLIADPTALVHAMDVAQALHRRRTCRAFLTQPVPVQLLQDILVTANLAPSGGNTQPWHLYVVTGASLKALTEAALKHLSGSRGSIGPLEYKVYPNKEDLPADLHQAYMSRRIKVAQDMWQLMGVKREDKAERAKALMENFRFWGAPVGIIVTVDRGGDKNAWGHVGMLLQSLSLLAVQYGLGTAMLEAWGNLGNCVYEALEIPMDREVIWCGVALGYPDPSSNLSDMATERRKLQEFCRIFPGFESKTSKL